MGKTNYVYTPIGIAVSTKGTLAVLDSYDNGIKYVSSSGSVSLAAYSSAVNGQPSGITADPNGGFYIVDFAANQVVQIHPNDSYNAVADYSSFLQSSWTNMDPLGIALGPLNSKLYVTTTDGKVLVFDPANSYQASTLISITNVRLYGIATDGYYIYFIGCNVYSGTCQSATLYKSTMTGSYKVIANGLTVNMNMMDDVPKSIGLSMDSSGYLYINSGCAILKYNYAGSLLQTYGSNCGKVDGNSYEFLSPTNVYVDKLNSEIYVADSSLRKIQLDGSVCTLASASSFTGQIRCPSDFNLQCTEQVVCDARNHTSMIQCSSTLYPVCTSWGGRTNLPNNFDILQEADRIFSKSFFYLTYYTDSSCTVPAQTENVVAQLPGSCITTPILLGGGSTMVSAQYGGWMVFFYSDSNCTSQIGTTSNYTLDQCYNYGNLYQVGSLVSRISGYVGRGSNLTLSLPVSAGCKNLVQLAWLLLFTL
ncbi:hypothetical protein HDV01_001616 [Terramyces sp. JEL0728]|nr:hypothetical protein HDV01_001616 [Terramyces sp. JEL0728]